MWYLGAGGNSVYSNILDHSKVNDTHDWGGKENKNINDDKPKRGLTKLKQELSARNSRDTNSIVDVTSHDEDNSKGIR